MTWDATSLAFYGLGAAAVAGSLVSLGRRLQLSKAKHRSLTGHARISRRLAALIPFYEYSTAEFFSSDGAPHAVQARRREGFARLSEFLSARSAKTIRQTAEARDAISD